MEVFGLECRQNEGLIRGGGGKVYASSHVQRQADPHGARGWVGRVKKTRMLANLQGEQFCGRLPNDGTCWGQDIQEFKGRAYF